MFCYVNFFSYICKKYINVMKQEERLEEAKRLYKDANADQRYVLESLFPELAEIEDVRIRKEIIAYIKTGTYHKDWITWLEKQGYQRFADKVEPKFDVGDRIQYSKDCGTIMTIEKIENGEYIFGNSMGHITIESGNKWHLAEQNPAWSEEDEQHFNFLEKLLVTLQVKLTESEIKKGTNSNSEYYYKVIQWLKSLRPQNKWKPSDEQIEALESATENCAYSEYQDCLRKLIGQLKKLIEE